MLELVVKLKDVKGVDLPATGSKIADSNLAPEESDRCPALVGGDAGSATTLPLDQPRPADCPKVATWYVKRHPIAFTLYFEDGKAFLDWFDHDAKVQEVLASRFVQGLFHETLHNLKIKAESLHLHGLEGAFMGRLLRDAIAAHGQLHYDIVHGKKGWVLSFQREDSPFAAQAVPAMVAALAQNGYHVTKLAEPVLEMRIGSQRLFMAETDGRVYLGMGLEALLNVIDSATLPSGGLPDAPVAFTVRTEAFVDKLLPVMAGSPTWDATAAFSLKEGSLGRLDFPTGKFAPHLAPALFSGVLAGIPHDAFAAVAASFHLSPTWTAEDWKTLATQGPAQRPAALPEESGMALVWDFDAADAPAGEIGIVIANQANPEQAESFQQYLTDSDLSAECGGGAVFLAASSEKLLSRMKEACGRQSLSVLDWERGAAKQRFDKAQFLAFVNAGGALREMFLAGGAAAGDLGDFEPRWKQEYEQAKARMRKDGDKLFRALPIFAYAGKAGGGQTISLDGFAVSQGAAQ